jgi:hypothetical protein
MVTFHEGLDPGGKRYTSSNEKGRAKAPASQNKAEGNYTKSDTPSIAQTALEIDLSEAERFLTLLDEAASQFTFQTFDDNKSRKDPRLSCLLHGTLAEHAEELTQLNQRGAGVFVLVQEGDGRGRKNENVKRIRAVFQEDDGEGKALPLEPHIIVQSSPGKHHRYLLVEGLSEKEFRAVQERLLVDYGSDKNAEDPARVLRLPGFYHLKDPSRPHRVRIVHESGSQPYTREQILAALPPLAERPRGRSATESTDARIPKGERNATLASWVGSMRRRGMSAVAIEAALLAENTMRCDPPLSELGRLAEAMKSMWPTLTLQKGGASRG